MVNVIGKSDKIVFIVMLAALMAGIAAGGFSAASMDAGDEQVISSAIQEAENSNGFDVFLKAVKREGIGLGILYIGGMCVFGSAAAVVYIAWRGYTIGFAVGVLAKLYGLHGPVMALAGMFLSYMIIIPVLLIYGSICARNSSELSEHGIKNTVRRFTIVTLLVAVMLVIGCLTEGFICSLLMKISL